MRERGLRVSMTTTVTATAARWVTECLTVCRLDSSWIQVQLTRGMWHLSTVERHDLDDLTWPFHATFGPIRLVVTSDDERSFLAAFAMVAGVLEDRS